MIWSENICNGPVGRPGDLCGQHHHQTSRASRPGHGLSRRRYVRLYNYRPVIAAISRLPARERCHIASGRRHGSARYPVLSGVESVKFTPACHECRHVVFPPRRVCLVHAVFVPPDGRWTPSPSAGQWQQPAAAFLARSAAAIAAQCSAFLPRPPSEL